MDRMGSSCGTKPALRKEVFAAVKDAQQIAKEESLNEAAQYIRQRKYLSAIEIYLPFTDEELHKEANKCLTNNEYLVALMVRIIELKRDALQRNPTLLRSVLLKAEQGLLKEAERREQRNDNEVASIILSNFNEADQKKFREWTQKQSDRKHS